MVQMDVITALKVVKEELDSNLHRASEALEQFSNDNERVHHLGESGDLLRQASSVLKLLGYDSASRLLNEMNFLIEKIQEDPSSVAPKKFSERMACLGISLLQLRHFLEYTLLREQHIPLLLLERINATRRMLGERFLSDASFMKVSFATPGLVEIYRVFGESTDSTAFQMDNVGLHCKPFRLMFQVGFLTLLKERQVVHGAVSMMHRSLQRLCGVCGAVPMTRLWFLARGVLFAFEYGEVRLTQHRLHILSKIERQIKELVYGRDELVQADPPEHLINDCLGVIALAGASSGTTQYTTLLTELQDLFHAHSTISAAQLEEETRLMNGPTGTVIQSVVQLVYDELEPLKAAMDMRARDLPGQWSLDKTPHEVIEQSAHTLCMIGELEAAALLREQGPVIERLAQANVEIPDEQMRSLGDTFVFVEQSLARLLGQYSVNLDSDDETLLTPRSVLEQARHQVFVESRTTMSNVKRAVASFVDSHGDEGHLEQVAPQLRTCVGALRFLHLDRASKVLEVAQMHIERYLDVTGEAPDARMLELLADVLISVDYYLESLEDRKSIGEGVLEAAELSVHMLKNAFEDRMPVSA